MVVVIQGWDAAAFLVHNQQEVLTNMLFKGHSSWDKWGATFIVSPQCVIGSISNTQSPES